MHYYPIITEYEVGLFKKYLEHCFSWDLQSPQGKLKTKSIMVFFEKGLFLRLFFRRHFAG